MGCLSVETVDDLIVRKGTSDRNHIFIARMPCHRKIQVVKHAVSRHKALSGSAFLARTAKEDHGSLFPVLLQILFYRDCSRYRARSEKIVAAAMSRCAIDQCGLFQALRLLAEA